jgi:hypothetical protein
MGRSRVSRALRIRLLLATVAMVAVVALLAAVARPACPDEPAVLVLAGARIYPAPDAAPIAEGTIVVVGGRIAAVGSRDAITVPAGARRLDCKGLTIAAGFQNSHIHFDQDQWKDAAHQPAGKLESSCPICRNRTRPGEPRRSSASTPPLQAS